MNFKSMDRNSITHPNTASLSLHRHSWNKHSTSFHSHILYQILSKSDENEENEGKIYLKPVSKAWISLHPFSRTTSMPNGITRSSVPNATHTRQQMWKAWVHIHLHINVEYECQWTYFHKITHALQLYRYVRIVAKSSYELRHVRLSSLLSACISAAPIRRISMKFLYCRFLLKSAQKLQIWFRLDKNIGHFTRNPKYTYNHTSAFFYTSYAMKI